MTSIERASFGSGNLGYCYYARPVALDTSPVAVILLPKARMCWAKVNSVFRDRWETGTTSCFGLMIGSLLAASRECSTNTCKRLQRSIQLLGSTFVMALICQGRARMPTCPLGQATWAWGSQGTLPRARRLDESKREPSIGETRRRQQGGQKGAWPGIWPPPSTV